MTNDGAASSYLCSWLVFIITVACMFPHWQCVQNKCDACSVHHATFHNTFGRGVISTRYGLTSNGNEKFFSAHSSVTIVICTSELYVANAVSCLQMHRLIDQKTLKSIKTLCEQHAGI